MVQHVFEHIPPVEVIALDVLALAPLERLVHGNDQQAPVHGIGLIAELGKLVDALNHEPVELERHRILELPVDEKRVARDD